MICRFVTERKARVRITPICRFWPRKGCPIAPMTYYARVARSPSKRALRDAVVTQLLSGYYEPDQSGRRGPEPLYGSLKMWGRLRRLAIKGVSRCQVERPMRATGAESTDEHMRDVRRAPSDG